METAKSNEPIVVGVDDSPGARDALEWAAHEAALRGAPLRVVHVFPALRGFGAPVSPYYYGDFEEQGKKDLDEILAGADFLNELSSVQRCAIGGNIADLLVEESRGAEMLVLGSRGRGGFAGLLLGSVSQQCVHHAHCPVVVVRPSRHD